MKFQVILEPSEDIGYTVYVPSLPGCISEGDSVEEALENIQEAIAALWMLTCDRSQLLKNARFIPVVKYAFIKRRF
jgi:predicted RNase H-like HicB family nuclease